MLNILKDGLVGPLSLFPLLFPPLFLPFTPIPLTPILVSNDEVIPVQQCI